MTDNDFIELVNKEFGIRITSEEVPYYKKAILIYKKVMENSTNHLWRQKNDQFT